MKERTKVLFLLHSLAGGGAERGALNVLKLLDGAKYERFLGVVLKEGPLLDEIPPDIELVQSPSAKLASILSWAPIPAGRGSLQSALKIRRIVKSINPDIVVSVLPVVSLPTYLALLAYPRRPFKWIIREENNTEATMKNVASKGIKRSLLLRWVRMAYSAADHISATSQGVRQGLIDMFGIRPQDVSVIYHALDVVGTHNEAGKRVSIPWPEEKVIVAVGRLTEQKAFDTLIRTFAIVRKSISARLMILGRGELKEQLEALSRELGVQDSVDFMGFVANPWSYMSRSDVFVLSSRWEGFARVIIEAMASGVPVISTDCDYGPGEIITSEKNGILVPVDDVEQMASAICQVLEDREMAESLIQEGLHRASDFDSEKICSQYEDLITRVFDRVQP